jgi:hypothetical protein
VHKLENEIFELKKVIFLFLFVISLIGAIIFFGAIFTHIIRSLLSLIWTIWLPILIKIVSKILFYFSLMMISFRLIFLSLYFFIFSYQNPSSDRNILIILAFFNSVILILYLLIHHLNMLIFMLIMIISINYFYFQISNNFLYEFRDQINSFFSHSFNQ